MISPFTPLALAAAAVLLIVIRVKRLAARPERRRWGSPHPRALAEALAAAITVLIVGRIAGGTMAPTPYHMQPAFTVLALGICLLQYRKTLLAPRA